MVRKLNEDSFISRDEVGLWAVADGMGGHQAGDVASKEVTSALGSVPLSRDITELHHATTKALNEANAKLISQSSQYDSSRLPGSTVVTLLMQDDEAIAIWAGDSRIYQCRNGLTQQITRDHSHVQDLLDQQLISPDEAKSHPMSNVITRAVGIDEFLELDSIHLTVMEGDRFLLCSDGLSRLVSIEEIQKLMQSQLLEESVQSLLHTALVRGAPDNVTVISVECQESDAQEDDVTNARLP
jgi:serine/threonine protein phosphatase PrpC